VADLGEPGILPGRGRADGGLGASHNEVRAVLDQKMEAPIAIHAGSPEVGGLVVFLGVQRGMVEILRQ
jgi:hypothetical protein